MRPSHALLAVFLVGWNAVAAPMIAPAEDDLRGAWTVASQTFEGAPRLDEKLAGSTWTFGDGELSIELRNGERMRFTTRVDASSIPRAFAVTPVAAPKEHGGWMIYERTGSVLRVAFFDDLGPRPAGFDTQPKLSVIALLPRGALVDRMARKGSACDILRAAGVERLLGPNAQPDTKRMPDAATQCHLTQPGASVAIEIVPAISRTALAAQRTYEERNATTRASPTVVQDEPQLGSAFSVRMGNELVVWAFKGDTLVAMAFALPQTGRDRIVAFAQRVLARM